MTEAELIEQLGVGAGQAHGGSGGVMPEADGAAGSDMTGLVHVACHSRPHFSGAKLGPYEIRSLIGKGGMGDDRSSCDRVKRPTS
jgi:hypothetical protein